MSGALSLSLTHQPSVINLCRESIVQGTVEIRREAESFIQSLTHSLSPGLLMPPLSKRLTEHAGDSCGMMLRGQTLKSGRRGAESRLCFLQASGIEQVIY